MKLKKTFKKHSKWIFQNAITIFSCVLIIVLGTAAISYADPIVTTIGENISTNSLTATGLTVNGNATTTGSFTVGTNNLVVNADGNVGIGTTTPAQKLSVAGIIYSGTGGFQFPDGTTQTSASIGGGSVALAHTQTLVGNASGVATATSTLTITDAGNLGIGTTSPAYLLDVDGGFRVGTSTNANQLVVNPDNGNIGIGTMSPEAKLQIAGLVYQSGLGRSTYFGYEAGKVDDLSDNKNTGVGYRALYSNTTGDLNSAMGYQALYSNTTSNHNSAMGYQALYNNTTGGFNSAMGYQALYNNTTGYHNSAMGFTALYNNTEGNYNSAVGDYTLYNNTTGKLNSAMGYHALDSNTTGDLNSAMGYQAGFANTTGAGNVFLGYQAGDNATSTSNNIIIGYDIDAPVIAGTAGNKLLNIGNLIFGTGVDGTGTTLSTGNVGIGTTTPSSKLAVSGGFSVGANYNIAAPSNGAIIEGNVGIGTTTPATKLDVYGTATTTISVMSETAATGGRIILEDSDGAGCTEIYVLDGVISSQIVTCPAN